MEINRKKRGKRKKKRARFFAYEARFLWRIIVAQAADKRLTYRHDDKDDRFPSGQFEHEEKSREETPPVQITGCLRCFPPTRLPIASRSTFNLVNHFWDASNAVQHLFFRISSFLHFIPLLRFSLSNCSLEDEIRTRNWIRSFTLSEWQQLLILEILRSLNSTWRYVQSNYRSSRVKNFAGRFRRKSGTGERVYVVRKDKGCRI